jgi:hypothetical protein
MTKRCVYEGSIGTTAAVKFTEFRNTVFPDLFQYLMFSYTPYGDILDADHCDV